MSTPARMDPGQWRRRIPAAALAAADAAGRLPPPGPATPDDMADVRRRVRWAGWCEQVPDWARDRRPDATSIDPPGHDVAWWLQPLHPARQHRDTLARWLTGDSPTLFAVGPVGVGKTHAATLLGYAAVDRGLSAHIIRAADYFAALRPGGADNPGMVRRRAVHAELLILDDLAAEISGPASDFARVELLGLLDHRAARRGQNRLIVTTNVTSAVLTAAFGKRIVSRLADRHHLAEFTGADLRQRDTDDTLLPSW